MTTIGISLSAVERIAAIHTAAADRGDTTTAVAGVCIKAVDPVGQDGAPCLAIVATDGVILVEETWTIDAGQFGAAAEEYLICGACVDLLSNWCKQVRKIIGKRTDATLTMILNPKQVTVSLDNNSAIGDIRLTCADAQFPRYESAFKPHVVTETTRKGVNLEYLARLAKLWYCKGMDGPRVTFEIGRSIVIHPLNPPPVGCQRQRAIVMPIILPT